MIEKDVLDKTYKELLEEKIINQLAEAKDIPAYISLEERMACGVGACLGCIVKSREVDAHSHVKNKRICTEGPVFAVKDLCL